MFSGDELFRYIKTYFNTYSPNLILFLFLALTTKGNCLAYLTNLLDFISGLAFSCETYASLDNSGFIEHMKFTLRI